MSCEQCKKNCLYLVGVVGAFLIMAGMVAIMRHYTRPEPPNLARAEERKKNLKELNSANKQALETYDWQDKTKGFVRVPVSRAMELVLQEWQDPAKARAQLGERTDKLNAAPPKPPEKKSEFE